MITLMSDTATHSGATCVSTERIHPWLASGNGFYAASSRGGLRSSFLAWQSRVRIARHQSSRRTSHFSRPICDLKESTRQGRPRECIAASAGRSGVSRCLTPRPERQMRTDLGAASYAMSVDGHQIRLLSSPWPCCLGCTCLGARTCFLLPVQFAQLRGDHSS
jgi:hypothetical protein